MKFRKLTAAAFVFVLAVCLFGGLPFGRAGLITAYAADKTISFPDYYTSGAAVRVYAKNTITASSSKTITNNVFDFSDGSNTVTANDGSFDGSSWSGSAKSVTFTVGGTSGHNKLKSSAVTYVGSTPTYTVTFDSNGGSSVTSQTIESGKKATEPAEPDRYGFIFEGWYNGEDAFNFNTAITSDITLTAKWTEIVVTPTFTVTIPAKVTLGDEPVRVEVTEMMNVNTLHVSIEGEGGKFELKSGTNTLPYTITGKQHFNSTNTDSEWDISNGETVLKIDDPSDTGNPNYIELKFNKPDSEPEYAGKYTGTVTFNIAIT